MSELVIELEQNSFEVPCKDIKNLYFQQEHLIIQTAKTFKLTTFAKNQLLYHLRLPLTKTLDSDNTPLLIANAIGKRAVIERNSLVFRKLHYYKDYVEVGSVVTTQYREVPISEARTVFEKVLENSHVPYILSNTYEDIRSVYFCYRISTTPTLFKGKISSDLTLIKGHSGNKSIRVRLGHVVEKCGNTYLSYKFGVLIHRNDTKKEILANLEKVTFTALKYLEPSLNKIVHVETSEKLEDIEQLFSKVIEKYPKIVQKILQQYFYHKYKNLKGLWRISQTLSDVGTNGQITESHRPRLQQDAFNILVTEQ